MSDIDLINKKYDKYKKNNLPTPLFDEDSSTFEYVDFSNNELNVYHNLYEALGKYTSSDLYYPFNSKYFVYSLDKLKKRIVKEKIGHNHEHSFEDVLGWLYDFPESFKILKKDQIYYSKQQLDYINRVKKFLLFIGLKDRDYRVKVERYRNDYIKNYFKFHIVKYNNKIIKDFISGSKNFIVRKYDKNIINNENKEKYLIINEKEQYKLLIQEDHHEIKKYKDIKKIYRSNEYKNDTKLILTYFNIIDIY